ncbi:hypothetical protein ACHHV8_04090 [Paenibacillus sp. TAB 01]|uniref:hypothetical protein n=1 Tax=Paenibacillus sp. TAB 01 TaxID=3368988 RepID=UPI003752E24C
MAKTFYPKTYIMVPASSPHPENTEYKVSIGEEIWGDKAHQVVKVQMVYNGEIAGRRSPSYPIGTDDLKRVQSAIDTLYNRMNSPVIEV